MNAPPETAAGPVLLFDGECGLCNRIVRWLLWLDERGVLRFAPLQGPSAQEFLQAQGLRADDFDTLVFVPDWARRERRDFQLRTAGVIAALRHCGAGARLLADVLAIFPRALRDAGYRVVARVRHRWFGPWRADALPRPEWTMRFFD